MPAAKIPNNEQGRLLALKSLRVLDTSAEAEFDAIVKAASLICDVPISLISLVDEDRQWFKANVGFEGVTEMPRELAFCAHAIHGQDILEVEDATQDARFADNPIVLANPNIRFYAGAPLRLSTGENVGTLCVLDSLPHQLSDQQRVILSYLATAATRALENHRLRASERAILTAEEALLEAANYTASIFRNTKEPIIALMLDGTVTHWNEAAKKLFGYSQDEILGENISTIIPPENLAQHIQFIATIAEFTDGLAYVTKRLSKAGELIDVAVSLAPLFNGVGKLIGATKIIHDIREQNKTRQLLADNEAKYRALSETSPLGVFATDATGLCTYTNKRWQDIFGLSDAESLGHGWTDTIHPLDREAFFDEWHRSSRSHLEFDMEFRVRLIDGTIRYVHSRSRPVIDDQGKVSSFVGSVEDITERRKTLARLATSEERLRKLYQSTPAIMQSIDPEGRLISVSDYWLEKHGYTRDEVIGRHSAEFMTQESAKYVREVVIPRMMQEGFCENIAYTKVKKNGELFDVLLSSVVEHDSASKPLRAMSVMVDVTEENAAKRATEALLGTIRTQFITSITDDQGIILEVNDAFCEISQYTREELIGAHHRIVNAGIHPKAFFADMWTCITQGLPWKGEKCNRAKDGSLYWIATVVSPLKSNNGSVERYISISTDITQRKHNEVALAEEQRYLASVIEATKAGTWQWNVATGECRFNDTWAAMLGYTLAELGEQNFELWAKHVHPDDVAQTRANQLKHFNGETPMYETEFRMRHKAGHWVWLLSRGRVLSWTEDCKPAWMYGTHTDIGERKQQQIALQKSQDFLDRTGRMAGVGGWEVDLATHEFYWSDQSCLIHGVSLGYKPTYEETLDAYPPEARMIVEAAFKQLIENNQSYDLELPYIRADGKKIWVRTQGSAEFVDGKAVRVYGAFQDITLRIEQQHAIKVANDRVNIATKSGGIAIWSYDVSTDQLHSDATINLLYGLPEDEILTLKKWASMLHPDDREETIKAFQDAIAGISQFDVEFRAVWHDGSTHYIRAKATITQDQNGRALQMLGTNWDVTKLRELSLEVAKQHETLRVTLQSIGDSVITTDAKGRVTWLNPVAERMTGWLTHEAKGKPLAYVFNILNEVTRKVAESPVAECLRHGKIVGLANHTTLISRDGIEYGIEDSASPIRSDNGKIIGVVLVFHDVTEQRRLSREMTYRANHDSLTGLVNRAEFEARLTRILNQAKTEGTSHALMFIDLDQFKLVNDACGHSAGDMLLKQVSKMFIEIVRSRDTLARLGGDEFGVILEQCTTEQAQRVAQTICDRMDEYRFIHDGKRFRIGASIGLSILDGRWANIANVIQAADSACYAAKEAGRNRVHTWIDADINMRSHQGEMQWATRIELAIDENQFELYAQRIFLVDQAHALQAESNIHAEVLLRLIAPDGEVISPAVFLPAAERFHLASRVDRWVLEHVIHWMQSLQDISTVSTICVNFSGQSIGDRAFHAHATESLMKAGRDICERICIEITETVTVTNIIDASLFTEQVRQLGVRVALDDFGAGASSFGYLKTLKVDMLKIDGQFIKAMIDDPLDDSAVRCFVDVARILGLKTVAEYVESEDILAHVRSLGIDYVQGYLMRKPTPIHELFELVPG